MFCIVQSSKDPDHVDSKIRAFLNSFVDSLRNMPSTAFDEAVAALISKKTQPDCNIHSLCERWNHEIANRDQIFDRPAQEAAQAQLVTLEDLVDFFEKNFLGGGVMISHSHRKSMPEIAQGRPKNVLRKSLQTAGSTLIPVCDLK